MLKSTVTVPVVVVSLPASLSNTQRMVKFLPMMLWAMEVVLLPGREEGLSDFHTDTYCEAGLPSVACPHNEKVERSNKKEIKIELRFILLFFWGGRAVSASFIGHLYRFRACFVCGLPVFSCCKLYLVFSYLFQFVCHLTIRRSLLT